MNNPTPLNLYEMQITPEQIGRENIYEYINLKNFGETGNDSEYIGLRSDDFSAIYVYKKRDFSPTLDLSILKWDGEQVDTTWYHESASEMTICNAEQLAGFRELVAGGVTFANRTIKLAANINLNDAKWNPIGDYRVVKEEDGAFLVRNRLNHTFQGTLDGCNHVIYGLEELAFDAEHPFGGLFYSLENATIKDLTFGNVQLEGSNSFHHLAALFGYAKRCRFENITVSGSISATHCASIGYIAVDCTFINCVNRADLMGYGKLAGDNITIGGIVSQIGISRETKERLGNKEPMLFTKCWQDGHLLVDASNAGSIFLGQLYSQAAIISGESHYGFMIDRCHINERHLPQIHHLRESICGVFFGTKDEENEVVSYSSGVQDKNDLLGGLIGKTDSEIAVTVHKITSTIHVDQLVIPGNINTLESTRRQRGFLTTDVHELMETDGIRNLEPYFKFIKVLKS